MSGSPPVIERGVSGVAHGGGSGGWSRPGSRCRSGGGPPGCTAVSGSGGTTTTEDLAENGGMASVWGARATNLPATGTVNYQMVGSTRPVAINGSGTPGTVNSAALAVNFGTMRAGFQASLTHNGANVGISSTGGTAAPSMLITSEGAFSEFGTSHISGFLAGAGGTHAGVSYRGGGLNGVIAFGRTP